MTKELYKDDIVTIQKIISDDYCDYEQDDIVISFNHNNVFSTEEILKTHSSSIEEILLHLIGKIKEKEQDEN